MPPSPSSRPPPRYVPKYRVTKVVGDTGFVVCIVQGQAASWIRGFVNNFLRVLLACLGCREAVVQGDQAACAKPPVDIDVKVAF